MSSSTPTTDAETGTESNHRIGVRDHALAALVGTDADKKAVKATVLHELYRRYPAMALEDILELSVSIAVPEADTVGECVDAVLKEAITQHDAWQTAEPTSGSARAGIPATEER
jgi:hypothetical protein